MSEERTPLTLEEFEKAFDKRTIGGLLNKAWPRVAWNTDFNGGMDDLYSTVGKKTPQEVKDVYFELKQFAETLINYGDRPASVSGFYQDSKHVLHVLLHTGSNGAEASIRRSLEHAILMIDKLREMDYWNDIVDVSIDNCDDVYSFYFRIYIEPSQEDEK